MKNIQTITEQDFNKQTINKKNSDFLEQDLLYDQNKFNDNEILRLEEEAYKKTIEELKNRISLN